MKVILFLLFIYASLLSACTNNRDKGVITFQLTKSDYIEKINISGTVQAVVNYPVLPPRRMFGQMTVLHLAADGSFVRKGDTICVLTVPELESMHQGIITSIETLEAELKKKEADNRLNVALLEAQLATSEAKLKISSLDSLKMNFANGNQKRLLELEIKSSLIEKQKIEKKLAATRIIGETEIRQTKARIMQEKVRSQTMEEQMNSMTIVAQREGIVSRTESPRFTIVGSQGIGTMGGPITEGSVLFLDTPVLQFPDLSKMQVSADVLEADFKRIEKGQPVNITVDAAEKLITTGKVNRKSLIGRTAQRYSDSKVKFYEIIIDIDSCHSKMKPGLSANCEITFQQTKDTLFIPNMALFDKDSSKVVYVLKNGKYQPVRVKTGLTGSSYTIITEGLKGDEVIALSQPPNSLINRVKMNKSKSDTIKTLNPE
jgi:hypothetical protein